MSSSLPTVGALVSALYGGRPLRVEMGEGWAYSPARRVVLVPRDAERLTPEALFAVVAHEIGHAEISRYRGFDLTRLLARLPTWLHRPLLNALEDVRLEDWLRAGSAQLGRWIDALNLELTKDCPAPKSAVARLLVFVALAPSAGKEDGWRVPAKTPPEDVSAYEAAMRVTAAFRAALPPLFGARIQIEDEPLLRERYEQDVRPRLRGESRGVPRPLEVARRVAAWDALCALTGDGEALQAIGAFARRHGPEGLACPPRRLRRAVGRRPSGSLETGLGHGHEGSSFPFESTLDSLSVPTPSRTLVRDVERQLRPLLDRSRGVHGWRERGARPDMRAAFAVAAGRRDPRMLFPTRLPDDDRARAAATLIIDCSGSMARESRIEAALCGALALADALSGLQVPFAVYGFQDVLIPVLAHGERFDRAARERLRSLKAETRDARPGGNNHLRFNDDGPCLLEAAAILSRQRAERRLLVVIADGHVEGRRSTERDLERAIDRIQREGAIELIGLGLGARTHHIPRLYPSGLGDLTPKELPCALARLIVRALRTRSGPGASGRPDPLRPRRVG